MPELAVAIARNCKLNQILAKLACSDNRFGHPGELLMYIDKVRSSSASFANGISLPFEVLRNSRSALLPLP
ncbi:hypothetical protein QUB63_04525 [Microcoleus sp. ARI1-B5]|uniref:hypothetical protein n=1 Tax=unclassified Microcoleus TaxID=2642155 RepID=UPI002FD4A591